MVCLGRAPYSHGMAFFAPHPASSPSIELDVRDYVYVFTVPAGASPVGPWHVVKVDLDATSGKSHILVRFVSGNRDDPGNSQHGEYARIEDAQTLSPCFMLVGGFGAGAGYMPAQTWTSEVLARPNAHFPIAFAAGIEFSSINPLTYQRIVALGPTFRFNNVYGYARYYRPSVPGQPYAVAPTGSFNLGMHATPLLDFGGFFNFGGEIGGDRTAWELPTSSGRYGPDAGGLIRYALTRHFGVSAMVERAWYRQAPAGEVSRRQTVISAGLFVRPSLP